MSLRETLTDLAQCASDRLTAGYIAVNEVRYLLRTSFARTDAQALELIAAVIDRLDTDLKATVLDTTTHTTSSTASAVTSGGERK